MIEATLLPPPQPPAVRHKTRASATRDFIWHFAERCLADTAAALHRTGAVDAIEIAHGIAAVRLFHAAGKPAELLEEIAKRQSQTEEQLDLAILKLGNMLAASLDQHQPLIPFAGKLTAPSQFYESFDRLHQIARVLLVPVVFAEDTDVIGIASVNPLATRIMAEETRNTVCRRFGIRPFVTSIRLDYASWSAITRKHFEL